MPKEKNKRSASSPSPSRTSSVTPITGLRNCYAFISPNEYCEETFGFRSFLLRQSVGDINFSDLCDQLERQNLNPQADDYTRLLEKTRENMKDINASVEKYLMIDRLIFDIQNNGDNFMSINSRIRSGMMTKITDNQKDQINQYPNEFRQREIDFLKRKTAQELRRLFYLSQAEVKEPPSLIHLHNSTTKHLCDLIDFRTQYCQEFCKSRFEEISKIIHHSFMITVQPQYGVNPVLIYDKIEPGTYKAKVSVVIVSLLHNFMRDHPNIITIHNIEPSLHPSSADYQLEKPQSLSWKTCQLQINPNESPQIIQYAEIQSITIRQLSKKTKSVSFAQQFHTFQFSIKVQVNLPKYNFSKDFDIKLESLPFIIGHHNNQIPQLLTRVILDDIKKFSNIQSQYIQDRSSAIQRPGHIQILMYFIERYFMHRTGVRSKPDLQMFLRNELVKAFNARNSFETIEDTYMDFLVQFVHQVEFMAKHPVLAMFYDEGLFLGPCDSAQLKNMLKRSTDVKEWPVIGLRFTTIDVDYGAIAANSISNRVIKIKPCAVRVIMYNDPGKEPQNLTFNTSILAHDLSQFVGSSQSSNANRIRILSTLGSSTNDEVYKSYTDFSKYYHERLDILAKEDEKYQAIDRLIHIIKTFHDNNNQHTNLNIDSQSIPSINVVIDNGSNYELITYDDQNNNNAPSISKEQLIHYILFNPELYNELIRQLNMFNLTVAFQQQLNPQTDIFQSNDVNQSQLYVTNSIDNTSQLSSTQSENNLTQSMLDIVDFLTSTEMQITSSDPDSQQFFDEFVVENLFS